MIENNELAMNLESRLSFEEFRKEVLNDYRLACESREISLLARKEVLTGKAKFGIFGDGKEVAQIAMSKYFQPGDFRSGYYRDYFEFVHDPANRFATMTVPFSGGFELTVRI